MHYTPVLDHGYVALVEAWGSDERIIESARMSTNKGFKGWPEDEKLLAFLWKNGHHSPFEQAGMTIEVQAPIFVFREWHRHRTQSYNELSARYTPLPDVNYLPTVERCIPPQSSNKQAIGSGRIPTEIEAHSWLQKALLAYTLSEEAYQEGLKLGIAKEVARIVLPVGRYSRMRSSANLRNWLGFLKLRNHPAAQFEIREYAKVVADLVSKNHPRTYKLFNEEAK